ncbi:MAG: hypothetical protein J6Z27_01325 [Bacteroidales bacterium]|nr:hypothetical protein [Bacteroidales bacterium]
MKISFFPVPEHKVFHYEPRFYNPKEEQMRKRYEKYGKDYSKANEPYQVADGTEADAKSQKSEHTYVPGQMIRGSFKSGYEQRRRATGNTMIRKIVVIIGVVGAILVAYYLAQGLGVFFSSL